MPTISLPLMSTLERYLPVLPVTVTVIVRFTLFVVDVAVIVTVCEESEPSEPPASRPVMIPVVGSIQAMLGSEEVQTMSETSPTDGTTFVGVSWIC